MEADKDSPKKLFESVKDSLNYEPSKEVKSETGTPNESDEEQSDEEEDDDDDDDDDDNDGSDNEAGNNADNECDSGDIDDGGVDSPMSIEVCVYIVLFSSNIDFPDGNSRLKHASLHKWSL